MFIFKSGLSLNKWQKMLYYIGVQAINSKQLPKGTLNPLFLSSLNTFGREAIFKSQNTIE